jgi:multiple sugar transport system permease protein
LSSTAAVPRVRSRTLQQRARRAGLLLVSPTLLIVLLVVVIPILWTFLLSFQELRVAGLRRGLFEADLTLDNFTEVVTSSSFRDALWVTLQYSVLGTAGAIGLGLVAALVVRRRFRGRALVRGLMLMPYVAPVVGVAFVWRVMLSPQFGVVNAVGIERLGWNAPIAFLTAPSLEVAFFGLSFTVPLALSMAILFEAWRSFPFAFLFLLARLQALPADLDEAALVDGAVPSQRFRYIVWPQLRAVVALLVLLRFIWTFNAFDEIYLLTGGGAGTEVVSVQAFNFLFARNDVGKAAAVSVVLALVLMVLLVVYLRFFAAREESG